MNARCKGTTKAGKRCARRPRTGYEFCDGHLPETAGMPFDEYLRRGLKRLLPKAAVSMKTAAEVRDVIEQTVNAIRDKQLDPQRGYAIGGLCKIALEAIKLTPEAPSARSGATEQPDAVAGTPKKRAAWAPPDLSVVEGATG